MAFGFWKFVSGVNLVPKTPSTVSVMGDLDVDSGTGRLRYHDGSTADDVVTATSTDTLSNKTIEDAVITIGTSPLVFEETGPGTDTISLTAPASIASSFTLTLPDSPGTAGYSLVTDGVGVLNWAAPGSGGNIGSPVGGATTNSVLFIGVGSALAQDNTNFNYDSSTATHRAGNTVLVNATGAITFLASAKDHLVIQGNLTTESAGERITQFGNTAATASYISLTKARGTFASPLALQSGDSIGNYFFNGFKGDVYRNAFVIGASTTEAWSNVAAGTQVDFRIVSNGSINLITKQRFAGDGTVQFGSRVSISGSVAAPDASALLDLSSTTLGFLPPRMTNTQRDAIVSPASGLVIYSTTDSQLNFYNGAWTSVAQNNPYFTYDSGSGRNLSTKEIEIANTTGDQLRFVRTSYDTYQFRQNAGAGLELVNVTDTNRQELFFVGDGTIQMATYGTGLAHFNGSGLISSSLIVNADVDNAAAIAYAKISVPAAAITRASLAAPDFQLSSSCGLFSTASASPVDVTNLSVSITVAAGDPVCIELIPDGSTSSGNPAILRSTGGDSNFYIRRNGTTIGLTVLTDGLLVPSSSFRIWDSPGAGTHTYNIRAQATTSTSADVYYTKLRVYNGR